MGRRIKVALYGYQAKSRFALIDGSATEGAVIGKNLFWSDGTLVTEAELRALANQTGSTVDDNLLNYINALLAGYGTGGAEATNYPLHRYVLDQSLVITDTFQYIVHREFDIQADGSLAVEQGGELVILDEPLPEPLGPSMTYDASDNLERIDYDDGSFKEFSYNGDQLSRVDFTDADGVVFRKDFVYSGDTLTDVNETYV